MVLLRQRDLKMMPRGELVIDEGSGEHPARRRKIAAVEEIRSARGLRRSGLIVAIDQSGFELWGKTGHGVRGRRPGREVIANVRLHARERRVEPL